MSEIHFDGPVTVDSALAMALWDAMPAVGKSGVAQMFFSRFVTAPIADKAIEAGARVFFEREKINQAGAKALREGVAEKCRALGEKSINPQLVTAIVDDETRKASAELAKTKVSELLSSIPLESLIEAATPIVKEVVKACAHHYFTRTDKGQAWLLALVQKCCEEDAGEISHAILDAAQNVAEPLARRNAASAMAAKAKRSQAQHNGGLDIAPGM